MLLKFSDNVVNRVHFLTNTFIQFPIKVPISRDPEATLQAGNPTEQSRALVLPALSRPSLDDPGRSRIARW
jgi:hypothetical protein